MRTVSVNVNIEDLKTDEIQLRLAQSRQHRLDITQPMDTEDVSDWIGVASAPVGIYIYLWDARGLYAGRLQEDEDGLKVVGLRGDLRRVGLI